MLVSPLLVILLTFSSSSTRSSSCHAFTAPRMTTSSTTRRRRTTSSQPPLQLMMMDDATTIVSEFGSSYNYCLEHFFFPTQSATGGIFSSLGDVIAQKTCPEKKPYDPKRTWNYFLKGLGGGILWACWFQVADDWSYDLTRQLLYGGVEEGESMFTIAESSSSSLTFTTAECLTRTILCIALEQFLVCPLFYTFWDIPLPALLQGSPVRQIPAQIEHKLPQLLVENAKIWTPVNFITYNIPLEFRVLFTSCADIVWQSINAKITSQEIIHLPPAPLTAANNIASTSFQQSKNATTDSLMTLVEEVV